VVFGKIGEDGDFAQRLLERLGAGVRRGGGGFAHLKPS
jgi:hypothetical protein